MEGTAREGGTLQTKTEGISGGRIRRAKARPVNLASGDSSQSRGVVGTETSSQRVEAFTGGEEMGSVCQGFF